ncbi:hypothetical protein HPB48_007961 [Haemaphysalis longicornis]|uniref:Uncharacterized protein n=1 Tax=Haemaphysalis longicornis TaxID=44386 RepID=A0A9J6FP84_HAELO|nr:hypothetical protein HPB48_007961 [Haemaphysalis longicornis]
MTKPPFTARSEASLRKRKREPSSITSTNAVSLSGCTLDNGKAGTSSECQSEPDTADASDPRISPDQLAERGDCNDQPNDPTGVCMPEPANETTLGTRVFVNRSCGTQTAKPVSSSFFIARKRWREKERALKLKNERLAKTVDSYKELRRLKEECHVSSFPKVVSDAEEGDVKTAFLFDQFKNYKKKTPRWAELTVRHCIIRRNLSAKAYDHLRSEELFRLPCRNTPKIHWQYFWRSWLQ